MPEFAADVPARGLRRGRTRSWRFAALAIVLAPLVVEAVAVDATPVVLASSSRGSLTATSSLITPQALVAAGRAQGAGSAGASLTLSATGALPRVFNPLDSGSVARPKRQHIAGAWLGATKTFPALGNDSGFGDCSVVAVSNIEILDQLRAGAPSTVPASRTEAIGAWRTLNGGNSAGVDDRTLLSAWSSPAGVIGTSITGWQSLDVLATPQIKRAIVESGSLYATLVVSDAISWSSLIWSNHPKRGFAHAVALIGWTTSGWLALSWGEVVSIPWSYWKAEAMTAVATLR